MKKKECGMNSEECCGNGGCAHECKSKCKGTCAPSGAIYGLGLIGAIVYFFQNATSFMDGVAGLLKAFVWPAFVVYELLKFFKL